MGKNIGRFCEKAISSDIVGFPCYISEALVFSTLFSISFSHNLFVCLFVLYFYLEEMALCIKGRFATSSHTHVTVSCRVSEHSQKYDS